MKMHKVTVVFYEYVSGKMHMSQVLVPPNATQDELDIASKQAKESLLVRYPFIHEDMSVIGILRVSPTSQKHDIVWLEASEPEPVKPRNAPKGEEK
jgi:hypothetical protein